MTGCQYVLVLTINDVVSMFFQHVKITSSLWAVTFLWTSASFRSGCTSRNLFTRSDLAQNDLKIRVHEEELQNVTFNSQNPDACKIHWNRLQWKALLALTVGTNMFQPPTGANFCLYIFALTTFPSSTRLLLSLVLLLSMVWPDSLISPIVRLYPILPTPLLLFSINICIRGSPSFITTMNTLKNSMTGSLVRSGDIWNNAWIFLP